MHWNLPEPINEIAWFGYLRTEKLVAIGAASRQELERIHAGHTARRADVESAASRLQLLGLSADAIEARGDRLLLF